LPSEQSRWHSRTPGARGQGWSRSWPGVDRRLGRGPRSRRRADRFRPRATANWNPGRACPGGWPPVPAGTGVPGEGGIKTWSTPDAAPVEHRSGGSLLATVALAGALGLLEAGGLVPGSRLRGIRVVLLGDQVPVEVLAVDGQALEGLTLIAGGQRVGGDAGLLDPGKAGRTSHCAHRVAVHKPRGGSDGTQPLGRCPASLGGCRRQSHRPGRRPTRTRNP
jgi:hypothetical protein